MFSLEQNELLQKKPCDFVQLSHSNIFQSSILDDLLGNLLGLQAVDGTCQFGR